MNSDFAKDVNLTLSDDCACENNFTTTTPPPPKEKQYNTCYLTKKNEKRRYTRFTSYFSLLFLVIEMIHCKKFKGTSEKPNSLPMLKNLDSKK